MIRLVFLATLVSSTIAFANISSHYEDNRSLTFAVNQRGQEELGYGTGFLITDLELGDLLTPQLDVSLRLRFLNNYGAFTVINFASSSSDSPSAFVTRGMDRPVIQARQLIYGNFVHGRWFIMQLGLAFFNITGFTEEYFRYWSGRIALHEALAGKYFDTHFELGTTVRSLTQFVQPQNVGLIYPPTVDALAGIERDFWGKWHLGTDIAIEQALAETTVAGSYNSRNTPYGASTRVVMGVETGYRFNPGQVIFIRGAERTYRWPETDNSALWANFDEGSLGRSVEIQWRGEW